MTRVSQACSGAKVDAAVEIAMEALKEQDAVVLFTSFVKSAEALVDKLAGEMWGCAYGVGLKARAVVKKTRL